MKQKTIEEKCLFKQINKQKENGVIKIVTGSGKSYLLNELFVNHLIENIVYNELLIRGYNVDVGVVEIKEGSERKQLEVDFVCNQGSKRYYIQVALNLDTREKTIQETKSLNNIGDSFKKIIVVKDNIKLWRNEEGILIIGIQEFLLNKESLDL